METKSRNPHQIGQILVAIVMVIIMALFLSLFSVGWALMWLGSYLIFAIICADMAKTRGRALSGGIVSGYYFGVFAILYYLIAGDSTELRVAKEEKVREKYRTVNSENNDEKILERFINNHK